MDPKEKAKQQLAVLEGLSPEIKAQIHNYENLILCLKAIANTELAPTDEAPEPFFQKRTRSSK